MKVLALDSSGLVASVAVVEEGALIGEYTVNYKKTHSQTLLPMVDALARMIELDLAELDAIAVANGPGSFTGLRIGAATAKGLGLALDIPLIGVPTVDALAYNLWGTEKIICPMMDARRNQVYTGLYQCVQGKFVTLQPQAPMAVEEIADLVNQHNRETIFLGEGAEVYREILENKTTVPFCFAEPNNNRQRAASVGSLGLLYLREQKTVSSKDFTVNYLRLSQAERERQERR